MTILKKLTVGLTIATADPAVTDDNTKGHYIGEYWLHGTSQFICTDASTGAAVWTAVGSGGGGGSVNSVTADETTIHADNTDPTNPVLSVKSLGIDTAELAALSVTTGKLAANAVTTAKLDVVCSTPGSFTNVDVTVDAAGRITAIANGTGGGGGGGGSADPGAAYNTLVLSMANLVSHWPMDEALGATSAVDAVGGNDMARLGADLAGMPGAILGSHFGSWQTVSGLRNVSPAGLPLGAAARTMIAWVRSKSTANGAMAFGYGSAGTRNAFIFYMNGSVSGDFNMSAYSDDIAIQGLNWNDGGWHMLVASYDGGTGGKLYFDGSLVATHTFGGALTTALNGDGVWAGASAAVGGFGSVMAGQVDALSIFSRQITDAEVLTLWDAGRSIGGVPLPDPSAYQALIAAQGSLVSYWRANDAFGATTLADETTTNPLTIGTGALAGAVGYSIGHPAFSNVGTNGAGNTAPTGLPLLNTDRTIEFVFASNKTSDMTILGYGNVSGVGAPFVIALDGSTGRMTLYADIARADTTIGMNFNDGRWHHVVATYGSGTLKLYVDGNLLATTGSVVLATALSGYGINIGHDQSLFGNDFHGVINDVSVLSAALTQSDVTAHFNAWAATCPGASA